MFAIVNVIILVFGVADQSKCLMFIESYFMLYSDQKYQNYQEEHTYDNDERNVEVEIIFRGLFNIPFIEGSYFI